MAFHALFKNAIKNSFESYFLNFKRFFQNFTFERLVEIIALEHEEVHDISLQSINKQIRGAIHLMLITGAPLSLINSGERVMRLYCIFLNLLRVVNFIFIAHFVKFFLSLNSLRLTYHAFNACAMASFAMMTLKRRDILQSLKTVTKLAPTSTSKKWKMWMMMTVHYIAISVIVASMALAVSNEDILDGIPSKINFCGWTFRDRQREVLLTFVKFSMTFTAFTSASMCSAQLVLCSTAYYYLSEAVSEFARVLKRRFKRRLFHQDSMGENLVRFKKTVAMVREMDDAFSYCMLFLYGASVMCIFNALSVALNMNKANFTLYIFAAVMFSGAMYGFLFLTYFGSRVTSKFNDLCDLLNDCSALIVCHRTSVSNMSCFSILSENIRTSDMHLTGGNMFVIRKDMILSVAGVMITYGVLIFQLDNI